MGYCRVAASRFGNGREGGNPRSTFSRDFSRVSSAWSRQCRPPSLPLLPGATVPCLRSLRSDFLYMGLFFFFSRTPRFPLYLVQTVYSTLEYQCFRTVSAASVYAICDRGVNFTRKQRSIRARLDEFNQFARHCLHSARSCRAELVLQKEGKCRLSLP